MQKRFLMLLIFSLTLSLLVPVSTKAEGAYKDVDKNNAHYEGIDYLSGKGIIRGYPNGKFKPDEPISRSQAAKMFFIALDLPEHKFKRVFKDIKKNHDYADEIMSTYRAGIFTGNPNQNFNDGSLTREQMASVLVRAFHLDDYEDETGIYLDNVDPSHKENVDILAQFELTTQLNDFRPREAITRGQFATFMYRTMGTPSFSKRYSFNNIKINNQLYELPDNETIELRQLTMENDKKYNLIETDNLGIYDIDGEEAGISGGLFTLLQLVTDEYSIENTDNPFLDGKIKLNYLGYSDELENSPFSITYDTFYETPSASHPDNSITYQGKVIEYPATTIANHPHWFEYNGLKIFNNGFRNLNISTDSLLDYLDIDSEISIGEKDEMSYIEIKK